MENDALKLAAEKYAHLAQHVPAGPADTWAAERLEFSPDARVSSTQMYEDYAAWCMGRGNRPCSRIALGQFLRRSGIAMLRTATERLYLGLAIRK